MLRVRAGFCASGGPLEVGNDCVRAWWTALLPTIVILFNISRRLIRRLPQRYRPWHTLLSNFLPLDEAVSIQTQNSKHLTVRTDHLSELNELNNQNNGTGLNGNEDYEWDDELQNSRWKKVLLAIPAALETVYWSVLVCRYIIQTIEYKKHAQDGTKYVEMVPAYEIASSALLAFSWLYAALRPLLLRRKGLTVPYDLFALYLAMFAATGLNICSIIYKQYVLGPIDPTTPTPVGSVIEMIQAGQTSQARAIALMVHVFVLGILLGTVLSLPMGIPPPGVDREQIGKKVSPEDYVVLWRWITFSWVLPLIARGSGRTMNEEDNWFLSPTLACSPLFTKFAPLLKPSPKTGKRVALIKRLLQSNSLDIILDFGLTLISVVCSYLSPFFLKRILDAVSQPPEQSQALQSSHFSQNATASFNHLSDNTDGGNVIFSSISSFSPVLAFSNRDVRATAYVYAFLAFLASVCKAQSDVNHLWYGRRAATRMRSEVMASIYQKALKRKDFSGSVDKDKEKKAGDDKGKDPASKAKDDNADKPDPNKLQANADVGKIVNLMSADANKVAMMFSALYMLYGAPLELIIASFFLYQLLGLSGFAGYIVLLVGSPLNSYLVRRARDINRATLEARDKRMKVLNELVSEAKFIKFFAWEDRWIAKVLEARGKEIKCMIRSQTNSVMFMLTWSIAPVLVSVISFTVYVYTGHQLTVSVAFTAVQIFSMIKAPMNIIPAFIVQTLNTLVAVDRINDFLDEEEVPTFVSSIKEHDELMERANANNGNGASASGIFDQRLGIERGDFQWNQARKNTDAKAKDTTPWWKIWKKGVFGPKKPTSKPNTNTNGQGSGSGSTPGSSSESTTQTRFELRDINIFFPIGKLTVVTGPTASGKTALLLAQLGEMTPIVNDPGHPSMVHLPKRPTQVEEETGLRNCLSYAAQSPWLEHASIKDNVLFGSPFDQVRYDQVLEACALKPDLAIFEDGDATEIGARGVSLSGGQKARVALARAVYARSKHVLLDDPLSAVDSHTARHLVEKLLQGPLMANRTVVLVTHHVELVVPVANYFVRMLDGRIDTQGTITDLKARGLLDVLIHETEAEQEPAVVTAEELATIAEEEHEDDQHQKGEASGTQTGQIGTSSAVGENVKPKKPKKLVEDEARASGSVKWKVYNTYIKATAYITWVLVLLILGISQLGGVTEKLWMQIWGEAGSAAELQGMTVHLASLHTTLAHEALLPEQISFHTFTGHYNTSLRTTGWPSDMLNANLHSFRPLPGKRLPSAEEHPLFYVSIFAAIGLSVVLINVSGNIVLIIGSLRASRSLFAQLLQSVLRATMRWHDTTPTGRILNRFSKDFETVDSSLSSSLRSTMGQVAAFTAASLTITIVFPGFVIPGVIIGYFYYKLSSGYMDAGRDLRRMESTTRSPIFATFGETLEGIITVRAFSAEKRFLETLLARIDETTMYWYNFWMLNRWLLLNFDFLGATAVLITTLLVLGGWISDWLAGLTITSAMNFTTSVYWACRMITQLELDLNSVERVVEYLELPQEPPAVIEGHRPPAYWPSTTSNDAAMITVNDLVVKYAPNLPNVLHGVSFEIKSKEKVGLLGRTGSGKSTLAMSLLRFVDPSEGNIIIDGIDITKIGLSDLRSRVTIIPQDSVLFSGTIKENLDPFSEHSDEECLDALYRVQLISESAHESRRSTRPPSVAGTEASNAEDSAAPSGTVTPRDDKIVQVDLTTEVSPRGANFSAGQRQLISMARALLRQSSIVILDEATSSIDFKTDAKIQTAVREEFKNSCLLTIAHRIKTVIDYDRLLILDKGKIVEFDTPYNLIRKEGGLFRDMCVKSGTFSELEQAAKEAASAN